MPVLKGKDYAILLRPLGAVEDATKLMNIKEVTISAERGRESEDTTDGSVSSGEALENNVTGTALYNTEDPLAESIEEAVIEEEPYEIWVTNKKNVNAEGQYRAQYRQGYFTKHEEKGEVGANVSYDWEFVTEYKRAKDWMNLPEAIAQNPTTYGFHQPLSTDPADDGLAAGMNTPTGV
ncbi:phage major tail protein, TP901-1 family [Salinicoccus roseus]|uniref:phage major tail protein, TP901-1 family n=1 Tax=Salinicoccus roseus TaxID=45670 RepID=UPI002301D40B|nr:phage major tail protein, TP901-1 family [Salinicoccus roseus]